MEADRGGRADGVGRRYPVEPGRVDIRCQPPSDAMQLIGSDEMQLPLNTVAYPESVR